MTTQAEFLERVRRGLKRGPVSEVARAAVLERLATHPRHLIPARSQLPHDGQVALFCANLEKEFATFVRVAGAENVPGAVAEYLAAQNLPPRFVMAPHPELLALDWAGRPLLERTEGRADGSEQVGLSHAFAGIAETGTLMMPSEPGRPTTVNLLPETEIVVLRAKRIVGAYEEAFDLLRAEHRDARSGGFMPRNVMLITGPSRTADIEQTLELGAHGPRRLHVVVIEGG